MLLIFNEIKSLADKHGWKHLLYKNLGKKKFLTLLQPTKQNLICVTVLTGNTLISAPVCMNVMDSHCEEE